MKIESRKLSKEELEDYKNQIRANLKKFDTFCRTTNLTYFLSDGTLLGAIRHQGMIPWDDDADLCMPRNEYNRLIELAGELFGDLSLNHAMTNEDYVHPFIKITSGEDKFVEVFESLKKPTGAWIDVFPLDGTYQNMTLRKIHFGLTKFFRHLYEIKVKGINTIKNSNKRNYQIVAYILLKPITLLATKKTFFRVMDFFASHKKYEKSSYVGNLYTFISTRASHKKEIFSNRSEVEFDGLNLFAPDGYDQYLKNLYGDYMTPPPISKRPQHSIEIILTENQEI